MKETTQPTSQVYSLDVLWWGVSAGGRHYTGEICWQDASYHKHEVERHLTLREAKALGDTQFILWTERFSRTTNRFDSLEQLERAAARWVRKNAAVPNWLLIKHDGHNPNRPIAAKGWYVQRLPAMRALAKAWDKVPDGVRQSNRELWDAVYETWRKLMEPPDKA